MNIEEFQVGDKAVTLYLSEKENMPLIILNNYSGNGASVVEELKKLNSPLEIKKQKAEINKPAP